MKKFAILSAVLALSACGCMNSNEEAAEPVVYQNVQARPQNCDYFDGTTCYRYVRRVHQAPVVRYREPRPVVVPAPAAPACGCQTAAPQYVSAPCSSSCAPQVSETREPVEVVYKKTTYTTVFEPKTSSAVSYERAPYSQAEVQVSAPVAAPAAPVVRYRQPAANYAPVEIVTPAPASVEVVAPANSDEEILLNVK